MPFDDTPREEGGGGEGREHTFEYDREVCIHCGITGEALLYWPDLPCDRGVAKRALAVLAAERARTKMPYRRGAF